MYWMNVCVHLCVWKSAWLSKCNMSALMDAHLSWSVQSDWSKAKSGFHSCLEPILSALFCYSAHLFPDFSLCIFLFLYLFHFSYTYFIHLYWLSQAPHLHFLFILFLRIRWDHWQVCGFSTCLSPHLGAQRREKNKRRWHLTTSGLDLYQAPALATMWMRHYGYNWELLTLANLQMWHCLVWK